MKPGQLRFALALVVLLHHSSPVRLGNWAVFVFFILSGYWIARLWDEKYSRMENSRGIFIISRWWRLFPVFLTCSLLSIVAARLLPGQNVLPAEFLPWLARQLPIAGSAGPVRPLGPTWSLDVEMQFYLVAALGLGFMQRLPAFARRALTVGFACLGLAFVALGGSLLEPALPVWLGFFLCGIQIHAARFHPSRRLMAGSLVLIGAGWAVAAIVPGLRNCFWMSGQELAQATAGELKAGALITFVNALLMVPFIACNVRQPSGRIDRWLGNWAYPLYLFHWIPRTLYYQIVNSPVSTGERVAWLLGNFAVALLGSWLILVVVDRPCEKIRTRWLAWREKKAARVPVPPDLDPLSFSAKNGVLSE